MRKLLLTYLFLMTGVFLCFRVSVGEGAWKSYVNRNEVRSIASRNDFVWCATSGGMVRWDKYDGSYIHFTKDDGLLSNDLRDIAVDGSGFAWISHADVKTSVSLFDGSSWTIFDNDDIGMPNRSISCVFADSNNRIWLGTVEGGLSRYDGAAWKRFDPIRGLGQARSLAVDRNGVAWIGTRFGVLRWDGTSWSGYTIEDGLPDNAVKSIAVDATGAKWFGTVLGLVRYDGASFKTYTRDDGLVDLGVNALAFDGNGVLWIGTRGGVSRFDGSSWTSYTVDNGLIDNAVSTLSIDAHNNVWVSHGSEDKGVSFFDGSTWTWYTRWNSKLPSNTVHAIACDSHGSVWFGTDKGLSRFDGVSWITYKSVNGLAEDSVTFVCIDSSDVVWVAHGKDGNAGVSRFNGSTWTTLTKKNGLIDNGITHIAEPAKGTMLFLAPNGVSRFDGTFWRNVSLKDWLLSPTVSGITEDRDGALWFATRKGLTRFDGSKWKTFTAPDSTVSDYFIDVKASPDGVLWCISAEGMLTSFDGENFAIHPVISGGIPSAAKIGAITIDTNGVVWTDTEKFKADNGIYTREVLTFDGNTWQNRIIEESPDELLPEAVSEIVSDDDGVLWFATQGGLKRYDGSSISVYMINGPFENSIQSIAVDRFNVKIFGTRRGIFTFDDRTWESISQSPVTAIAVDRNNDHWYGTLDGVSTYDHTTWKRYRREDGISNNDVRMVAVDSDNVKWFVTADGLSSFGGVTWNRYSLAGGMYDNNMRVLTIDRNDTVWVGAGLWPELVSFDSSGWKHYRYDDGTVLNRIQVMTIDRDNLLWIGTHYGLSCFDGVSVARASRNGDLPSDNVTALAVDLVNVLWVGTDRGISRYDGVTWETFTVADGLISNMVTSIAVDLNNVKWIGTTGGVSSFEGSRENEPETPSRRITLIGNAPNPFNMVTRINFELVSWGPVTIDVYNSIGQKIREMNQGVLSRGRHTVVWDGTDDNGSVVSTGVYFYQVASGENRVFGRMMLLK